MLHSFSQFIADYLPGKIQKLAINAGFSCPNRTGEKGIGGCIYCNNSTFSPDYTLKADSISQQIENGITFFNHKYPEMRYLAYFQSYTSTNAPIDRLLAMYDEALSHDKVDGLIIGTRPDCMPQPLLDALKEISKRKFVMVEYGAESANESTLSRINRCHTWEDTVDAVSRTASAGIPVGLHIILGLPGENIDDIFHTVDAINNLPVATLKCHQLQIVRGTRLARDVESGFDDFIHFTPDSYAELCVDILLRLRSDITVERFVSQAPDGLLIYPRWGLKNYHFTALLEKKINDRLGKSR